ncbi:hypothetical protein TRIUR3_03038 [Triticum urartu]|uniref:Uncharacterized protein n=1 Tax=Triticum urartu TaxID=4572 RepID=M7YJY3_TRIUA|nr:hypothetical protein TRIUR3_03038 [Triticum urartu]
MADPYRSYLPSSSHDRDRCPVMSEVCVDLDELWVFTARVIHGAHVNRIPQE